MNFPDFLHIILFAVSACWFIFHRIFSKFLILIPMIAIIPRPHMHVREGIKIIHNTETAYGQIKVVGCQLRQQTILDYPVLRLDAYLECERPADTRYVLQLDIYSRDGQRHLLRHYFVAADRIYPTKRWKKGEKVKISQNLLIPQEIRLEEANIMLNFARVPDK